MNILWKHKLKSLCKQKKINLIKPGHGLKCAIQTEKKRVYDKKYI